MKMHISVLAAALLCCGAVQAADKAGEIGYKHSELGYDALMAGNNEQAAQQILAQAKAEMDDPAKLINLGRAYARMGRYAEAAHLFQTAIDSKTEFEVELSDGRVLSSRVAAQMALGQLSDRMALR